MPYDPSVKKYWLNNADTVPPVFRKTMHFFLFFIVLFFISQHALAANRFAVASGSWSGSIWAATAGGAAGSAAVPTTADVVTINASSVVNITAAAVASTVSITGTLNLTNNFDLTLTNAGALFVQSGGVLSFSSGSQILGGGTNGNGILITVAPNARVITANTIGLMAGVTNAVMTGSFGINRGNRGGPNYHPNADYVFNGTAAQAMGTGITAAGDITISNTTAAVNPSANITVSGGLIIDPNANLSLNALTLTLSGGGNCFTNSGTLTPGSSTVTYSGTTAQNVEGTTYNNLTFSGAGGKFISTGNTATVAGNWVTGTATITMTGNGSINVTGTITGTAAITMGTGTLTAGATGSAFGNTGTFTPGSGTVAYTRAGTQTVRQTTYNNLTLGGTNAKTTTTVTVNGILSMEGSATASVVPTYGVNATLRYNTSTNRAAGVEWPASFTAGRLGGGVIIDNTGTIAFNAAKVLGAGMPLTIQSGADLDMSTFLLTLNDDLINNGGNIDGSGGVVITGTAGQSIGSFTTTGTLSMTKTGGTATLANNSNLTVNAFTLNGTGGTLNLGTNGTLTVLNTYTNTAGTVNGSNGVLNLGGGIASSGGNFIAATGTVNFTGASAQTVPAGVTWHNLGFSGAGAKAITGDGGADGTVTIEPTATVNMGAITFILSGSGDVFTSTGTFNAGTSTIAYTNAAQTTIAAVDYYNLYAAGGPRTLEGAGTIGIKNIFTPGVGTYTVTNSTVDFNGTGNQDIPTFIFNKLLVSNAGIKKILASVVVECQTIDIEDAASVEINADGGGKLNVTAN